MPYVTKALTLRAPYGLKVFAVVTMRRGQNKLLFEEGLKELPGVALKNQATELSINPLNLSTDVRQVMAGLVFTDYALDRGVVPVAIAATTAGSSARQVYIPHPPDIKKIRQQRAHYVLLVALRQRELNNQRNVFVCELGQLEFEAFTTVDSLMREYRLSRR
jgi:hypothetical protein